MTKEADRVNAIDSELWKEKKSRNRDEKMAKTGELMFQKARVVVALRLYQEPVGLARASPRGHMKPNTLTRRADGIGVCAHIESSA
jgi:hypothetical protein